MKTMHGFIAPYALGFLFALIGGSAAYLDHQDDDDTIVALPPTGKTPDLVVTAPDDNEVLD